MGSLFGDWPSFNPHNFSQLRPADPSNPSISGSKSLQYQSSVRDDITVKKITPATYHATHNRTVPPPDQVISTESTNILLRQFYQRAEEKLRPKRAASESLVPEHGTKQPRGSFGDTSK